MKTFTLIFVMMWLVSMITKPRQKQAIDPVLTKLTYYFQTNNDDKDWNTQVAAQVIYQGHVIAQRFCCSADRIHDHWDDRSLSPVMQLPIAEAITKQQLGNATYVIGSMANGNDRWNFDAHLHAEFSDGTKREWSFLGHSLNSRGSARVSNTFSLK
jgi:hypothetical protein